MQYVVPDEVIERTDECHHNFSCLETGRCFGPCKVDHPDGKDILVLKKRSLGVVFCRNHVEYGDDYVCLCPVHYHLYQFCR